MMKTDKYTLYFFLFFLLALFFSPAKPVAAEKELPPCNLYLKHPQYQAGSLITDEGGVITAPQLRIQAKHLIYTHKKEKEQLIHFVIAEGDLMVENKGQIYVGRRLEYDFITKTGIVYEGRTAVDFWFLGGEKIKLKEDKSFYLFNAFITTSEGEKADWKIQSRELLVNPQKQLSAKNVTVRLFDVPIFWFPSYTCNLKTLTESPAHYKIEWDKGNWPRLMMRYRIYSWETLSLFLRFDVRPSKGVGSAFESYFKSLDKRTKCETKSFAARDAFYRSTHPDRAQFRYRLQGFYKAESENKKGTLHVMYDKISDKNLPSDFKSDLFERNPTKETFIKIKNQQDFMIVGLNARPRINSFQGFKQELPHSFWTFHPFTIGSSKIVMQNRFHASYLNYTTAEDIDKELPDFRSVRLETVNELYRPFSCRGFSLTPLAGFIGIFYSNSRKENSQWQAIGKGELLIDATLQKSYPIWHHVVQPYFFFQGLTSPTLSSDTPFIFDVHDGYHRLACIKAGIRNLLYSNRTPLFDPNFSIDLYFLSFLKAKTFTKDIPKAYGLFTWNFPSISFRTHLCWNIEKEVLDLANIGLAWTISKNFAFKTEFRHRSRFYWRRDDPHNYIMEATRSIADLLQSPLSDGKNTLFSRLQINITPQWILRLESHIGWGRKKEPSYNEIKVDLLTTISTNWQLRLSYIHAPSPHNEKNDRIEFSLKLLKH